MKKIGLLLVLILAILSVTACGGGNTSGSSSPAASNPGGSGVGSPPASAPAEKTKVNFALNWVPGPQHMEFVAADKKDFFTNQGLEVNMHAPSGTTDALTLVASGQDDFGIAYAGDVIQAVDKGVPVVSVASIHRKITLGLLSNPESNIKEPKDLIGKTIGITQVPNNRAMFYDFLKRNGIEENEVNVVPVGFDGPQLVASGKLDACDAVTWYEAGVYKQITGKAPSMMLFTDYGVPDGYFMTIITSKKNVESKPEIVSKFVQAILEAEKWTLENPDEARQILIQENAEVSEEFAKESRSDIEKIVVDDDTAANGLGWQSDSVWSTMTQWYYVQGLIKALHNNKELFTNDFLPKEPIMAN